MDNRVRIVIDMYHERFDTSYHKEQGNDFILQPSAIGNLMNVVDHVHHMVKTNYANIEHYTAQGKLNYLQHLYVVFTELKVPAQIEMNAEVKALLDIFHRYYEKNHTEFKKQSDLITEVFYSYFDNQNDDKLPSKIAHNNKLCKNQTFERFLQSVIDRADDAFASFYSLPLVEIEEIFQSAMKSNTVDDS
jgi:hypothetical protein